MEIPYLEYFGLSEKPFGLTPDPFFYFESQSHKEAMEHLDFFLAQREGFAVIHGDVGLGKTTMARIFLSSLDRAKYNTAFVLNPIMDEVEFLKELVKELRIDSSGSSKKEFFDVLTQYLLDEHSRGKETVIVIDEAQLISDGLLEFIRILSNIETEKEKIIHLVLFGQPEMMEKLKEPRMRYLSQRITVVYELKPFSSEELGRYVSYRLIKAGSKGQVQFDLGALRLLYVASRGYPRLINRLCDRCLLALYAHSESSVSKSLMEKVLKDEDISLSNKEGNGDKKGVIYWRALFRSRRLYFIIAIVLLILYAIFNVYALHYGNKHSLPVVISQAAGSKAAVSQSLPAPGGENSNNNSGRFFATVNVSRANVRAEPRLDAPIISVLQRGDKITVYREKEGPSDLTWYYTTLNTGLSGWIANNIVSREQ